MCLLQLGHGRIIEGWPPINIDTCFRVNILTVVDKCTVTTSDLLYASSHRQTFAFLLFPCVNEKRNSCYSKSHDYTTPTYRFSDKMQKMWRRGKKVRETDFERTIFAWPKFEWNESVDTMGRVGQKSTLQTKLWQNREEIKENVRQKNSFSDNRRILVVWFPEFT